MRYKLMLIIVILTAGMTAAWAADFPGLATDPGSTLPPLAMDRAPVLVSAGDGILYCVFDRYPVYYFKGIWWRHLNSNWFVAHDYSDTWVLVLDDTVPNILIALNYRFVDPWGYYPWYSWEFFHRFPPYRDTVPDYGNMSRNDDRGSGPLIGRDRPRDRPEPLNGNLPDRFKRPPADRDRERHLR
jgi:hypothetical protein